MSEVKMMEGLKRIDQKSKLKEIKGIQAKAYKEKIQKEFFDWLEFNYPALRVNCFSVDISDDYKSDKNQKMTDVFCAIPGKLHFGLFIKFKAKNERLTAIQLKIIDAIFQSFYACYECNCLDQAVSAFKYYIKHVPLGCNVYGDFLLNVPEHPPQNGVIKRLTGKWKIVEVERLKLELTGLTETPYLEFYNNGFGKLYFNNIYANIDYRINRERITEFSFYGEQDNQKSFGRGLVETDCNVLRGYLFFHEDGVLKFKAEKQRKRLLKTC